MTQEANPASSKSGVNQTQAGSQTGGAQAGAGSAYQSAGAEVTSDIGQAEAYIHNMKRLVEQGVNLDTLTLQALVGAAQRIASSSGDTDAQIRKVSLDSLLLGQTALANAVALSNRINNSGAEALEKVQSINQSERERTLRNGDVLDVIREAGISADTTVFQDAIEAAVAKAVTREVAKAMSSVAAK